MNPKGVTIGFLSPIVGTIMSLISALETGLRLASLAVGFGIGVITFYRLLKNKKKNDE